MKNKSEEKCEPLSSEEIRWFRSFKLHTESVGVGDKSFDWINLNVAGGGLHQVYEEQIQESKKRTEANMERARKILVEKDTKSDGKEGDS